MAGARPSKRAWMRCERAFVVPRWAISEMSLAGYRHRIEGVEEYNAEEPRGVKLETLSYRILNCMACTKRRTARHSEAASADMVNRY